MYGLVGSVVQHIKLKHPTFHNSPQFHALFNSKTRKAQPESASDSSESEKNK
jgi:hypothetical protein